MEDPGVPPAQLQRAIAEMMSKAGTPTRWVECPKGLPGAVGRTTRCVVTFSPKNAVTALLTTTQVNGDSVDWEISSAELTKEQVAARVAAMTSSKDVECDANLDGRVGEWVTCQASAAPNATRESVEVTNVNGLKVDLKLVTVLPKQQVERLLLTKIAAATGRRPDAANCDGDLLGVVGSAMQCSVTTGDNPDPYVIKVVASTGGMVDFTFAPRGLGALSPQTPVSTDPGAAGPEMCSGCPD